MTSFEKQKKDYNYRLLQLCSSNERCLLEKYHIIEMMMGENKHNPTEGYHCEVLLKEYLREHLPEHIHVDTGFVKCNPTQFEEIDTDNRETERIILATTSQIDILIHDQNIDKPIERTGDCVFVAPDCVNGVIEVKKNLTSKNLSESLIKFYRNRQCIYASKSSSDERVVYGVFSYGTSMSIKNIIRCIERYNQNNENNLFPDFIVVLGKYFIVFDESVKVKIYEGSISYSFENENENPNTKINIGLAMLMKILKAKINNGNNATFDEYPIEYSQMKLLSERNLE